VKGLFVAGDEFNAHFSILRDRPHPR
jgi:hypothetical protein